MVLFFEELMVPTIQTYNQSRWKLSTEKEKSDGKWDDCEIRKKESEESGRTLWRLSVLETNTVIHDA